MSTGGRIAFAKPGIRVFAALLDFFFYLSLLLLISLFWPETEGQALPGGFLLTSIALAVFYPTVFLASCQATPGMMLASIRLIDVNAGEPPGIIRITLRTVAWLFAIAPMGLGLLPILINKRNQGLHDKIAGTLVIDDDEASKTLAQLIQESK